MLQRVLRATTAMMLVTLCAGCFLQQPPSPAPSSTTSPVATAGQPAPSSIATTTTATTTTTPATSDPPDDGNGALTPFEQDLVVAFLGALVGGLVALVIAQIASNRTRQDVQTQLDLARDHREAEWVRDAASQALSAAQDYRSTLDRLWATTSDQRSEWFDLQSRWTTLQDEIPVLQVAAESAQAEHEQFRHDHGHVLQNLELAANSAHRDLDRALVEQSRCIALQAEIERGIGMQHLEQVSASVSGWVEAKALAEVQAPSLGPALIPVETHIGIVQAAVLDPREAHDYAQRTIHLNEAFTAMLAEAGRQVRSLLGTENSA
ncbi:hypothetical protein [Dermatobacter hominis]|uniref:hypothetical protein n=1 Tax=Dermatobacter hominis TaxID=2884263 RepID=UPI001D11EA94|nr:hypothetical protein [Dermatobacter hominis]UDY35523.1 hypothetical protein LH044_19605 [Dermatobacter hominis]